MRTICIACGRTVTTEVTMRSKPRTQPGHLPSLKPQQKVSNREEEVFP